MHELDGTYFSDAVSRKFGENIVVPGVGLAVVYPLNDYVRTSGSVIKENARGHDEPKK